MGIENVVHAYNAVLLSHLKEWNNASFSKIDGPRECYTEWNKSDRKREMSYDILYMWNLKRSDTKELTKQKET